MTTLNLPSHIYFLIFLFSVEHFRDATEKDLKIIVREEIAKRIIDAYRSEKYHSFLKVGDSFSVWFLVLYDNIFFSLNFSLFNRL